MWKCWNNEKTLRRRGLKVCRINAMFLMVLNSYQIFYQWLSLMFVELKISKESMVVFVLRCQTLKLADIHFVIICAYNIILLVVKCNWASLNSWLWQWTTLWWVVYNADSPLVYLIHKPISYVFSHYFGIQWWYSLYLF